MTDETQTPPAVEPSTSDATEAPEATETPSELSQAVESLPVPEDFEPAGGELVVADPANPVDVFRVLDRHDEEQILRELQQRLLDVSLYDFPGEGGKRNVDLSYTGVRECIHLMTRTGKCRIRVVPGSLEVEEIVENGESHYRADVWAEDTITGESFVGSSHEPKRMKLKAGTAKKWREKGREVPEDNTVWDEFARTKAINKAQRNALKQFVPEHIRQTLIAQYLKDPRRVQQIKAGAGAEAVAELPPPLTDERAEGQKARCRELYDEIRGVAGPTWIVPAYFHSQLLRVEHSHERLGEFVAYLEGKLEQARTEFSS